ncbi:MAG: hypothetical protein WAK57_01545, partial [Desulfobacterales bacterium]
MNARGYGRRQAAAKRPCRRTQTRPFCLNVVFCNPEGQPEMLPFFPALRLLLMTIAAIGLLVLTGCGVKGPPRPPQMMPPPPVTDLQGRVEDG